MDYSKLSEINVNLKKKVNDSASISTEARRKYLATKQKLSDSVRSADTKKIFDSAIEALKDSTPEHVIRALVSLLAKKDSTPKRKKYAEIKDSETYKALKKKIKDEMLETETTEDAIEVVQNALDNAAPEEVLSAAVEILAETVDVLQEQLPENQGSDEDYIEDSATHKGKLRVKDSFTVGETFEGNGVKGKIKEVKEDSIIVETQNEDGDVEDKEINISEIC